MPDASGATEMAADESDTRLLLTASEAYPELERLFLNAKNEICLSFRIFDPLTRLRTDEAREIGDTWMTLIAHTLDRGVRLRILIADFDPVLRPELHRGCWASVRAAVAAGELSSRPELLTVRGSMHPARVGFLPRLLFWPGLIGKIKGTLHEIETSGTDVRRWISEVPLLRPHVRHAGKHLLARLLPIPVLVPVSHHQKFAVVDEEQLYIGGLDLNDRRWDTLDHDQPAEETWHDMQVLIRGPIAKEAKRHFETFEAVAAGAMEPPKLNGVLRTLSRKRKVELPFLSPKPLVSELHDAHKGGASRAQRLIYLETQFLRDRRLCRHLAKQAKRKPELELVVILPGAPEDVAFEHASSGDARYGEFLQADCVRILRKAFGQRLFLGSPAQRRSSTKTDRSQIYGAPLVYLHAKVSVFDTTEAIVSSCNLNGRSLHWDTEAGVRFTDNALIEKLLNRCTDHWIGTDAGPEFRKSETFLEAWKSCARENVRLKPEERRGFLLPYASAPARRFGRNLPGIPEEMV